MHQQKLKSVALTNETPATIVFTVALATINGFRPCGNTPEIPYSNSCMIRLIVLDLIDLDVLIAFQFQHGTIKGEAVKSQMLKAYEFQFQHGTIKGFVLWPW